MSRLVAISLAGGGQGKGEKKKEGKNMAVKIDDKIIEYVGILAKLNLSEEEKKKAGEDMSRMLEYIDKLNELDTRGTAPMSHIFDISNVFREDEITNGDQSGEMLSNAPRQKDKQYQVPRTVE